MKKSLSQLQKKADKIFQLYIRLRDTDSDGYGHCITCHKRVYYKEADAGHFQSRSKLSTRYNEKNVHLQCKFCNCWGGGQQYKHGVAIDTKYEYGTAKFLDNQPTSGFTITAEQYEEIIKKYTKLVKEIGSKSEKFM